MAHSTGLDTLAASLVDIDGAVQLTREIVRIPSVVGEEAELVRLPVPADVDGWASIASTSRTRSRVART